MYTEFYQITANDSAAMNLVNSRVSRLRKEGAKVRVGTDRDSGYCLYVTISYHFENAPGKEPVPVSND